MKIAIFEVEDKDREFFRSHLADHELLMTDKILSLENASEYKDIQVISTRSFSQITAEVLQLLLEIKFISSRTTGTDHIDTTYCKTHGITLCNVPGYGQYTVAEHTFALLLAISRNIIPSVAKAKDKDFAVSEIMGFELYDKTLGVIGVGSIGGAVIRIAKALGMRVIAYTKHPDLKEAQELGFTNVDLDTLFAQADIISLHVPNTPETHHLINREAVAKMKIGVVLINTARGTVIDTDALIEGLKSGKIKAAGLDVLEHERDFTPEEHELFAMPNVIITPHNAFNSIESLQRILKITIENITAFINGKSQNVV
jgi:D-lactate dehydrogenase